MIYPAFRYKKEPRFATRDRSIITFNSFYSYLIFLNYHNDEY